MAGTGIAYPADAVSGSPTYTALNGRNAFSAAMAGATSTRPLGGISGIRPGTPTSSLTVSSTTWSVGPFAGYIDLEAATGNSGYFFAFNGTSTGSVTAAGGSSRTDILYVQIADSNTSDGSSGSPRVILDYVSNYPTNALPARAFILAKIVVPASGGGSPTITLAAPWTVAAGGVLPVHGSSEYPTDPYIGQLVDDVSLGYQLRFNGTNWGGISSGTIITPTSVAGTGASLSGSKVTLSACTSFALNGIFSSLYDHYIIDFSIPTVSAATSISARMRLSGTDDGSSNYFFTRHQASGASQSSSGTAGTAQTSLVVTESAVAHFGQVHVWNPATAVATRFSGMNFSSFNSGGVVIESMGAGTHGLGTAYDGITFITTPNGMTGTVSVYGFNR